MSGFSLAMLLLAVFVTGINVGLLVGGYFVKSSFNTLHKVLNGWDKTLEDWKAHNAKVESGLSKLALTVARLDPNKLN